jgi:predicted Zn-ribbon and HTH transcriptional regulator
MVGVSFLTRRKKTKEEKEIERCEFFNAKMKEIKRLIEISGRLGKEEEMRGIRCPACSFVFWASHSDIYNCPLCNKEVLDINAIKFEKIKK